MQTQGKLWDINGLLIGQCPADKDSVAVAFLICPEAECITASSSYTLFSKDIESRVNEYQHMIDRGETEYVSSIAQQISIY
jgi:hypothetical protein